jgi:tRNA(Arg) A34 adenosine deaminase TadA
METGADAAGMLAALKAARRNLRRPDGGPFGACIVRDGRVLAVARNTVLARRDPTCHAEINAIRLAARRLGTYDLSGCRIYSTTEPCPMCFSAIHWAGIDTVAYGTRIADVGRLGFRELTIANTTMKRLGNSPVTIAGGVLREECLALLQEWQSSGANRVY